MTYVEVSDIIDCDTCDSVIIGEGQHDTPHLTSLYHCDTAGPSVLGNLTPRRSRIKAHKDARWSLFNINRQTTGNY